MPGTDEIKKTVEEALWKPQTQEEKEERIPIVKKRGASVTDNGTIRMEGGAGATAKAEESFDGKCKKFTDDSIESRKEQKAEGMSLLRKMCFVLSFNGGILYVLVLGWLLPCRLFPCLMLEDTWTTNLTNIRLTTNLAVNCERQPSLVLFGYADEVGQKVGALQMSDGQQAWSKVLMAAPRRIFCHSGGYDFIIGGKSACVVTSDYFLAAIETEKGSLLWEHNITSSERLNTVAINQETSDYLMGLSSDYLHVLSAANGTQLSRVALPCSWTVDIKLTGPWFTNNGYLWSVVCEYEDGMEAFAFNERILLDLTKNAHQNSSSSNTTFDLLFSQQSYSGAIDLAGDVTSTSRSLLLSRADMVAMVTAASPSALLRETWKRRFPDGHVTSSIIGHFTDSYSRQVAVAVKSGTNSTIHVLRAENGSSVAEVDLISKTVLSLKKAAGAAGDSDALIIELVENKNPPSNSTNERRIVSYFVLHYGEGKPVFKEIAESAEDIHGSNVSTVSEGLSNLLLASTEPDGSVLISRHLIKNNPEHSWCNIQMSSNTSTVMFFE